MTILEAAQKMNARRVSSVELVQDALNKAHHLQSRYNAFITFLDESALEQAKLRDEEFARGESRGPLHGIPYAVKDNFFTKGVRTTAGSRIFEDFTPDEDAAAVQAMNKAGAVLLGKLGMHELAYGVTSNNPHFGPVRNPWDKTRIPGGSSGGSAAAVAAGIVPFTLGSDTGGSIRIPAGYCGIVGLKATMGLVSTTGMFALSPSQDHAGPLTQNVQDAALVMEALVPKSKYLPQPSAVPESFRIGIPEKFFFENLDPEVEAAVRTMAVGAIPVELPDMVEVTQVARTIQLFESSLEFKPYFETRRQDFGEDVAALVEQGMTISKNAYEKAKLRRLELEQAIEKVWQHVDCLITPTLPIPAPVIGAKEIILNGQPADVRLTSTRLTRPWNLLGNPAISIPCGRTRSDLPIGAQLIAPMCAEASLLRLSARLSI